MKYIDNAGKIKSSGCIRLQLTHNVVEKVDQKNNRNTTEDEEGRHYYLQETAVGDARAHFEDNHES